MRHLLIFFVGLVALCGSLVATFGTAHIRDFELRGYVDATLDQNLPFSYTASRCQR